MRVNLFKSALACFASWSGFCLVVLKATETTDSVTGVVMDPASDNAAVILLAVGAPVSVLFGVVSTWKMREWIRSRIPAVLDGLAEPLVQTHVELMGRDLALQHPEATVDLYTTAFDLFQNSSLLHMAFLLYHLYHTKLKSCL